MLATGKNDLSALPVTVGGWPLHPGGDFLPPPMKGGGAMSTSEVLQLCLVIIGICSLFLQARDKKK